MLKPLIFIEILIGIGSLIFYYALNRQTRRTIGTLPGLVFASMAAVAFLSPSLLVTNLAVALIPIVVARSKLKVGIVVATGMIALPALQTDLAVAGVALFPWSLQSSTALGGFIALMITPGRIARAPVWTDTAIFIVIAVLLVVDARGTAWTNWLRQLANYAFTYILPVYVVTRSAANAVERRTLLTGLAGAGVILAVIVLYEARSSWPIYSTLAQHYGFSLNGLVVKWRGGMMRAYGPLGEATAMGFVLVICFSAAFCARRAFISNTAYVWIVSLIALGALAPQSRGGLIGVAVAFVISSFYRRGVGSFAQIGAALSLLVGAYVASLLFGSVGNQISTSLSEAKGTGDYRSELLRRGVIEFWKNPIFGDSYDHVVARMQDLVQGEGIVDFVNSYLYFALFSGAIGLILFCAAFILPISRLAGMRARLQPNSADRDVAGFCLALLGSAAVMLAFTSYLLRPGIYLLIASSMALMMQVPLRVARARPPGKNLSSQRQQQAA